MINITSSPETQSLIFFLSKTLKVNVILAWNKRTLNSHNVTKEWQMHIFIYLFNILFFCPSEETDIFKSCDGRCSGFLCWLLRCWLPQHFPGKGDMRNMPALSFANCLSKESLVHSIQKSPSHMERRTKVTSTMLTYVIHFIYLEFQGKQIFLTGTVRGTVPGRQADMGTNKGSTSDWKPGACGLHLRAIRPGSTIHWASGHPLLAVAVQCWSEWRAACFLSRLMFLLSCFFSFFLSFFFFSQLALLAGNNEKRECASHLGHCSSHRVLIFTFKLVFKKTKGTSLLHLRQV